MGTEMEGQMEEFRNGEVEREEYGNGEGRLACLINRRLDMESMPCEICGESWLANFVALV